MREGWPIHERGIDGHIHLEPGLEWRFLRIRASPLPLGAGAQSDGTTPAGRISPRHGPPRPDFRCETVATPLSARTGPRRPPRSPPSRLLNPSSSRHGRPPLRPACAQWQATPPPPARPAADAAPPPHRCLHPHRDLEQEVAQPRHLGPLELRSPRLPPQLLQQHVRRRSQQHPELVRQEVMAARAVQAPGPPSAPSSGSRRPPAGSRCARRSAAATRRCQSARSARSAWAPVPAAAPCPP